MTDQSPADPAFTAVLHLAQQEGLGGYRASFRPQRSHPAAAIGLLVLGVLTLILVVGVLFLALAFMTPNLNRARAARRLHFFDGGLVIAGAKGPTAWYRWDSVSCLQSITRRYVNGVYTGTTYVYTMTGRDGTRTKITNFFEQPEQWGAMIQREITNAQVPTAVAALEAGRTVEFGPLAINLGGLATGNKSIGWSDIQEFQIVQGYLRIKRTSGWMRWSAKPVSSIPNFFVFLTTAERVRQAHRSAAQPPGTASS